MKNHKLLMTLLLLILSFSFVSCQDAEETTKSLTTIELALNDLEFEGYSYILMDNAYLGDLWAFGNTYELIRNEYTILDDADNFAAYIQVFDMTTYAEAHLNAQLFVGENQAMVVYENLLIAAIDYDVIEIITGEVYSAE